MLVSEGAKRVAAEPAQERFPRPRCQGWSYKTPAETHMQGKDFTIPGGAGFSPPGGKTAGVFQPGKAVVTIVQEGKLGFPGGQDNLHVGNQPGCEGEGGLRGCSAAREGKVIVHGPGFVLAP